MKKLEHIVSSTNRDSMISDLEVIIRNQEKIFNSIIELIAKIEEREKKNPKLFDKD